MTASEENVTALAPDTVLYQRVGKPEIVAAMKLHKAAGRRVVLDFDDNLHALPPSNPVFSLYGTGKPHTVAFEQALQVADVVTCSTQGLKDEYRSLRSDIRVIPNALAPEHVAAFEREYTGAAKRPGEIRIGYAGTASHAADLEIARKPLIAIKNKYPQVRLVTVGQYFDGLSDDHHIGISPERDEHPGAFMLRYYKLLDSMDFDIALAPLQSNTFNRCKSWIKAAECGICGIPVVASNFWPYAAYEGKVALASGSVEWASHLIELIESASLRAELARENYRWIAEHGTSASTSAEWRGVLLGP